MGAPPSRDFSRPDPGALDITRGDKPNRKQFGPDAKPFRNRSQKSFRPEGGKKTFKEKTGGQLYSMDDEEELLAEPEIDNFATSLEDEQEEKDDQ